MKTVVVLVCLIAIVAAQDAALVGPVNKEETNASMALFNTQGCSCNRYYCKCGFRIDVDEGPVHIHGSPALELVWHPTYLSIALEFLWNDRVEFTHTWSAINPPPVCVDFYGANLCLELEDIHLDTRTKRIDACINFKLKLGWFTILNERVGCFSV